MHARAQREARQHQKRIQRRTQSADPVEFFNILTSPELLQTTEEHLPEHRERCYPPTVALSMFLMQVLSEDGSCQEAVNTWAARCALEGLSAPSVHTGGYCKARGRLTQELVSALVRRTAELMEERVPEQWAWRGRCVKLIDGTTVSMPDTPANQARYPQSSRQAQGVGFPIARVVAVLSLASGALHDAAIGPCVGKGGSELGLLRGLLSAFEGGDIALGDALYCNYFLIAALQQRGVDVLFEQQGGRITDFRRGQRLGARDHLVAWPRPRRPEWMSEQQYGALPKQLTLRETQVGGRVLVSTLLDAHAVCKQELLALYQRRWNVELDLRNIKTTLDMDVLSCRSPEMNEKQMWVFLLAYNLIRLLMAQAASLAGLHPRQLSFKHAVQLWNCWVRFGLTSDPDQIRRLLQYISSRRVGNRPARHEPRARKRRPKPFPLLHVPRSQARQQLMARYAAEA